MLPLLPMLLRLSVVFVLWVIFLAAAFQAVLHYPLLFDGGSFCALCAASGALGLIIGKIDWVATIMLVVLLPVASLILISVMLLGYIGL